MKNRNSFMTTFLVLLNYSSKYELVEMNATWNEIADKEMWEVLKTITINGDPINIIQDRCKELTNKAGMFSFEDKDMPTGYQIVYAATACGAKPDIDTVLKTMAKKYNANVVNEIDYDVEDIVYAETATAMWDAMNAWFERLSDSVGSFISGEEKKKKPEEKVEK